MNATAAELFWWVALPYLALGVFIVGHVWRWRYDQFGWTSRSTQLQERRLLKWGGPLFHYGTFAAIAGPRHRHPHPGAVDPGDRHPRERLPLVLRRGGHARRGAGHRRGGRARGQAPARAPGPGHHGPVDYVTLILLLVVILTGIAPTIFVNLFGHGYDYRTTVAPWFRGLFSFAPRHARDRARAVHLPAARHRGLGDLGAVAVQPPGARLELPRCGTCGGPTSSSAAASAAPPGEPGTGGRKWRKIGVPY